MTGLKYNLIVSRAMFWFLKTDEALDSCACKAIFGHWSCHDKSWRKLKCACALSVGAKTYDDVRKGKTCDSGTSRWYLLRTENALFILFCRRKWKNGHNIGAAVPEKRFYFFPFYSCFFFISIPNVNWFFPQFINVMATNNDLLMDELHVSYFAQKFWLYVMIWLPRTTDNSTHLLSPLKFEVSRVDCN